MGSSCFSYRLVLILLTLSSYIAFAQSASTDSSSKHSKTSSSAANLESGSVTAGVYHNRALALTCKIPAGWVLRTDEMNAQTAEPIATEGVASSSSQASTGAKLLLAAFSRPPEARGEDINASILIAAEPLTAYPGLKDAAQYFEPLTEVAKAQGFTVDEDPYEAAIGWKSLVRGDFHKDVGSRVMRQSTLAFLAHGYAVSITVIAGTEDEVEELMNGLAFTVGRSK